MKYIYSILSLVIMFSLIGPNFALAKSEMPIKENITVEYFEIDTLSDEQNEEYIYEDTGSKKVESITIIREKSNEIETEITTLEDFYDLNGEFYKSVFKTEIFTNNYKSGEAKHKVKEKEYKRPQVDLIKFEVAASKEMFVEKNLNEKQKNEILRKLDNKKNEENFITKEEEIQGLTFKDIEEIKQLAKEFEEDNKEAFEALFSLNQKPLELYGLKDGYEDFQKSLELEQSITNQPISIFSTTERKGAFDTYYTHNLSTGSFVAQALSASPRKYAKVTGTTRNNSKNAASLVKFKTAVSNWENYVITRMNHKSWPEVAGWASAMMGLVALVAGYGTGPAGWVSIVLYYGGALSTFAGLTSTAYATYSRIQLSKTGAQYNQNARNLLYYTNWSGAKFSVVPGY